MALTPETSAEMRALAAAEARLDVALPPAYRSAVLERRSFQKNDAWELFRPDALRHAAALDVRGAGGIAVGVDGGGNVLLFLFEDGHTHALGETLYVWDHASGEITRKAASFTEVFVPTAIDAAATAILGAEHKSDDEYDDDDEYNQHSPSRSCADCGTDVPLSAVECPQCHHVRGEKPEDRLDKHTERWAMALVDKLVADGTLELANQRSRQVIINATAPFFDGQGFAGLPIVSQLLRRWEELPDVGEIFLDEDELEAVIASLKFPGLRKRMALNR